MLESKERPEAAVFFRESGLFLSRMLIVCALFFPLFIFRMIGAGDIKLAALICGYSGVVSGAAAIALGFLIGAVWSFLKMMAAGSFQERFSHLTAYIRSVCHTRRITPYYDFARDGTEAVIPMGVCLFFGAIASIIMMPG